MRSRKWRKSIDEYGDGHVDWLFVGWCGLAAQKPIQKGFSLNEQTCNARPNECLRDQLNFVSFAAKRCWWTSRWTKSSDRDGCGYFQIDLLLLYCFSVFIHPVFVLIFVLFVLPGTSFRLFPCIFLFTSVQTIFLASPPPFEWLKQWTRSIIFLLPGFPLGNLPATLFTSNRHRFW